MSPDPYKSTDVAAYAVQAAMTFNLWVHRRSETISFPDPETIRRHLSVDFTMPQGDGLQAEQIVFLPLHILQKVDLRNFNLTTADGTSLTNLTAQQNGEVACLGLEALLADSWKKDLPSLQTLLRRIVFGMPGSSPPDENPVEVAQEQADQGEIAATSRLFPLRRCGSPKLFSKLPRIRKSSPRTAIDLICGSPVPTAGIRGS